VREKKVLQEIKDVRQVPGEGRRRWFTSPYFDLIVWYGQGGALDGFQLTYGKPVRERAVTWRAAGGFSHERVDDGEVPGQAKMTPILVPDGSFDAAGVASRFREESAKVDEGVARLVLEILARYPTA
jgi:hypothetical protein